MYRHARLPMRRIVVLLSAALAAFALVAAEEVPPAQSKPMVGVYYYPWYRSPRAGELGQWRQVMRLHLKAPQKPCAGLYDSGDPEVIGRHIAQSVRAGVDFWAVSWWGPQNVCDANLRTRILTHPDARKLKYAILYEATGRLGSFGTPDYRNWLEDLAYLAQHYFDNPLYLKIGGRPVVFVYLTREYFRNKGQQALAEMRKKFPQVYLVGDDVFGPGYKAEWARNFDAVTAYDVYGQSIGPLGATGEAVEHLARNYAHAKAQAAGVGTAFMPTVAPGYNDTAVRAGHPGRARYFSDVPDSKEGDVFRAMIRRAALPHLDARAGRIMMVTSFNEWYEDSQIEPTEGTAPPSSADDSQTGAGYTGGQRYADYGELYLDILREEVKGAASADAAPARDEATDRVWARIRNDTPEGTRDMRKYRNLGAKETVERPHEQPTAAWSPVSEGVRCGVIAPAARLGVPCEVTLLLANVGARDIAWRKAYPLGADWDIVLVDAGGKKIERTELGRKLFPPFSLGSDRELPVLLRGCEVVRIPLDLAKIFRIDSPGAYTLRVVGHVALLGARLDMAANAWPWCPVEVALTVK